MTSLTLILYNLFLHMATLLCAPIIAVWLLLSKKARSGFQEKLGLYPASFLKQLAAQRETHHERQRIWLHAVSVGEFNAIKPLINRLQERYHVVVTTTTRTGQSLAKATYPELPICCFPYDFPTLINRAFKAIQPDLVIITETEIWPNMIYQTTRTKNTPLFIINGRISPGSFKGYSRIKPLIRSVLNCATHLYMQSDADAERIQALGAEPRRITVSGNLKFDVNTRIDPRLKATLAHQLNIHPDEEVKDSILTLASTHHGEDLPLIKAYQQLKKDFPELKLIIAPRHPERASEIQTLLNAKGLQFSVRSKLTDSQPATADIIILDTIGELLTMLSLSNICVMGGSFIPHGGQNPLEALSQKVPVIFGPHMFNFSDISKQIIADQAGLQASDPKDLIRHVTELLTQPQIVSKMVKNGQQLLEKNRGSRDLLLKAIDAQMARTPLAARNAVDSKTLSHH